MSSCFFSGLDGRFCSSHAFSTCLDSYFTNNGQNDRVRKVESQHVSFISSPEHEVLMVSYCDQSLSVVRALSTLCFK